MDAIGYRYVPVDISGGGAPQKKNANVTRVDITEKLAVAMVEHSTELIFYKEHYGGLAAALYFYENVKPGGDWDFKAQKEWGLNSKTTYVFDGMDLRFDDIGNIHYGFVGHTVFSESTLLLAGGIVQIYTGTSKWSYWNSNFDDPHDQWAIQVGCSLWGDK